MGGDVGGVSMGEVARDNSTILVDIGAADGEGISVDDKSTLVGSGSVTVDDRSTLVGSGSVTVDDKSTLVGSGSVTVDDRSTLVGSGVIVVVEESTPGPVCVQISMRGFHHYFFHKQT